MGKDIRGIKRGKYNCGECDDFMRSDGVKCGYCGCLPTRHSKKDLAPLTLFRSSKKANQMREREQMAILVNCDLGAGARGVRAPQYF